MSWMVIVLFSGAGVLQARAITEVRGRERPRRPAPTAAQNIQLGSGSRFTHPGDKGAEQRVGAHESSSRADHRK